MLTVQPKIQSLNPSFRGYYSREDYETDRREWENEISELESLKKDQKSKFAGKILKGGVVIGSAGLGYLAGSFGMSKVMELSSKIAKSNIAKSMKKAAKSLKSFLGNSWKAIKKNFLESDIYKKPVSLYHKQKTKLLSSDFGKRAHAIYTSIKENKYVKFVTEGIKSLYRSVKNGIKFVYHKVKGVQKETVKEATTSVFGVASGIASAVSATNIDPKNQSSDDAAIVEGVL